MAVTNPNPYPWGQCTYYCASVYPQMPADMGNGKDWLASARRHGFPISDQPRPGWVVVYSGGDEYSQYGHVAVVQGINTDGSFVVREMNMKGLGVVDSRSSSTRDVEGFFLPPGAPGAAYSMPAGMGVTGTPATAPASSSTGEGIASGFVNVLVNGLLVLGGIVVLGVGLALAVFSDRRAAQMVQQAQQGALRTAKSEARARQVAQRRTTRDAQRRQRYDERDERQAGQHRERMDAWLARGYTEEEAAELASEGKTPRRQTRAQRIYAAAEQARREGAENRVTRSAEEARALKEIPF